MTTSKTLELFEIRVKMQYEKIMQFRHPSQPQKSDHNNYLHSCNMGSIQDYAYERGMSEVW
jgi:type IV secretory pathway component VirB8